MDYTCSGIGCSYTYQYGNTLNLHYIKITLQTRICISAILLNNVHTTIVDTQRLEETTLTRAEL